jgi:hypothetical protein
MRAAASYCPAAYAPLAMSSPVIRMAELYHCGAPPGDRERSVIASTTVHRACR